MEDSSYRSSRSEGSYSQQWRGTKKIRSIVVELPKSDVIPLNPESFLRMGNLEILINRNAHFSGCVNYLPNSLRWFDLGGRSSINIKHIVVLNLQSNFHPRYLVKFDMSYSDIRQLKGFKILEKLTWMNLSGCEFLEKIPDLSGSPNLKHLNLSGCKNLVEVDDFVGFLDKLVILDLSRCSKLTRFATRLGLRSLEELNLCGCTRLERFPEIEKDKMKSLTRLEIGKSGIRELPSSIAYLTELTELVANGCELQNVPDLSRSPNIKVLDLSDCTSLVEVHDSVGFLGKLEFLHLNGCSKLTRFATRLGLRSLIGLYLKGCTRLETFPEIEKDKMNSLTRLEIGKSGIRELPSSIAYLTGLTDLVANGCELQNVPDLSGSPNIKVLDLRDCTSLVEVHDSVGFLDKLEFLHLNGCSKLTRFVTRLGLRSLIGLYLKGCTRLETFPEIEKDKMKSLTRLEIGKSGIRELPSSIAYLTGLTHLSANGCELQNVPDLSGNPNISYIDLSDCTSLVEVHDSVGFLDKLEFLHLDGCSKLTRFATRLESRSLYYLSLEGCRRLESFPEIEGKMESLSHLNIQNSGIRELPSSIAYLTGLTHVTASGCELQNIQLLPFGKKVEFDEVSSCGTNLQLSLDLEGCNLSERDFLAPLDCWSALTSLNLSRNNFVSLPNCISKVVNLETLFLRDCKRLREIPVLPPKLEEVYLDDCTSLEKIPKLLLRLKRLNLCNCSGLSGDELAKLENNLLNEEIDPRSELDIIYPGNEVPKWFSYTSNHPTTIQPLPEYESDEYDRKETYVGGREFRFEIPLKLQVGETLLGLALSFVVEPSTHRDYPIDPCIIINGEELLEHNLWYGEDTKATHVRLALVGLWEQEPGVHICQVVFRFQKGCPIKSCGAHCLLRPTSSLGMRPHPRRSSDIVDDEYDQEQQWLSSSSEDKEQE